MDAVVKQGRQGVAQAPVSPPAGLRDAVEVWAQVSIAGIGGPALQIPTMHRLLVEQKRWISEQRFFHAFSYCIALPGPETQQLSIYVGWLAHRMLGGLIAGALFILPGATCMMALSFGYVTGADSQVGNAIFLGIRPAILAVMAAAILRFGKHVLQGPGMTVLAAAAFVAAFFKVSFPVIVAVAAVAGACSALAGWSHFARQSRVDVELEVVSDETLPDHTRPNLAHFVRTAAIWLTVWLAPVVALLVILGAQSIYTQISFVFSKVALMAIGGDYAVVAYAAQQVVDTYHWISAREMQEAVAMGEMVPGTIMIVTQFLGFLTAYRDPGALPPLLAGVLGGLLATWVTFAPCFLWILVAAPFIDGLRRHTVINSMLLAVTAAAIGMILNLTVWFGIRTLFHKVEAVRHGMLAFDMPVLSSFDPWTLALFVCAAIAVLRFNVGTLRTLAASAAAGIGLWLLGLT